jgi:hypothetical protein
MSFSKLGGHMKNEITVTEEEINKTLSWITFREFPKLTKKTAMSRIIYSDISEWHVRKIRKAAQILILRGEKILPHNGGYSMYSNDPKPVREYLNKEYHKLTESKKKLDAMYHTFKETFGDLEAAKVKQMPEQPALIDINDTLHNV